MPYDKRYFERYADLTPTSLPCYAEVMGLLGLAPSDVVLDLGSGIGAWANQFSQIAGTVVAVDFSLEALAFCKLRHPGVNVIRAEVTKLPFRDGSFSKASCLSVIEHLVNPKVLLEEVFRTLKQDGVILLVTPDATSFVHKLRLSYDPTHVQLFHRLLLESIVSARFRVDFVSKVSLTNKLGPFSKYLGSEIILRASKPK